MTVAKITDYAARIVALEVEQFKGAPNTTAILNAIAAEIQAVEEMFFQVIYERWIATAVGAQLDALGVLIGIARGGRDDTNYRAAIIAQIAINIGGGQVETIIAAILNFATPNSVEVHEGFPAAFQITVEYPTADGPTIAALVRRVKAGGVALFGIIEGGTDTPDYTVANLAARLALTAPPLVAGDVVLQTDTGSYWAFNGGDPSNAANWTLVGPAFIFNEDTGPGDGFSDLTQIIAGDYIGGGVLGNLISS